MSHNLLLADDISAGPTPLKEPTTGSLHALVIGGGVIGLTTAWLLLDQGVKVTVVAKEWTSAGDGQRLSSQSAGALWKSLPLECGPNAVLENLERNQKWSLESYQVYCAMASIPQLQSAIELRPCTVLSTAKVENEHVLANKIDWVQNSGIVGFRRGQDLIERCGVNPDHAGGILEAYEYAAPVINVDIAMSSLMSTVKAKGAAFVARAIHGDLLEQEKQLMDEYKVDTIINASGLGAGELASDSTVYGLHGALLRLINDGTDFPVVKNAMIVASPNASNSGGEGAFILPRQDNILALGTISKATGAITDLTVESNAVKTMRAVCEDLLPCLKNARLDPTCPLVRGTRPQRRTGVRVERETRKPHSRIIHSYGHGGAGWSLAFGTAREVAKLVDNIAQEISTTSDVVIGCDTGPMKPDFIRVHPQYTLQESF